MLEIYAKGLFLGASLIIAIGLQNAFILRQGLKKKYVFISALTASTCDAALITAGVLGFGTLVSNAPFIIPFIRWAGALFLFIYGCICFKNALKIKTLLSSQAENAVKKETAFEAVVVLLGVSLLNPHVYLDTVVLLGGLSASYGETGKFWFGYGAVTASFVWFFSLAYGARLLAPVFQKPIAWKIFDIIIGITMWGIGLSLILSA